MYICGPTIIYLVFSFAQIFIDTFQGFYNTAFMKTIVMILFSFMLNLLCISGLGVISWIIVLVPFLFMSVIVAILLIVFGLDPQTGEINNNSDSNQKSGNLIFSTYNSNSDTDSDNNDDSDNTIVYHRPIPNYSSDPQYESFINLKKK